MHIGVVLAMSKRIKQNCCADCVTLLRLSKIFSKKIFLDNLSIFKIVYYGADHTHLFDEGG